MQERVKIGEIKKALKRNKMLADGNYTLEERQWPTYNSSLREFGNTFDMCLPREFRQQHSHMPDSEIFASYIEDTLSRGQKLDLTAVEFGGPGSKLFRGFTNNFFRKTVGVCLEDIRDEYRRELDSENNHSVITGNVLDPINTEVLTRVTKELGVNKVDLIISRMDGPLAQIVQNLAIFDRILRNWYSMLNENGLMFVQYESVGGLKPLEKEVQEWSTIIQEKFPQLDIQAILGVIRLHKRFGSPEKLPPATQLFK